MASIIVSTLRPAVVVFTALTLVTGVIYPAAVTGIAKVAFPHQAAGSLIERDGKVVGSSLIGQNFSDQKNFWGRLSATSPMSYNAASSGGSNLGPTNPALIEAVKARVDAYRAADPGNTAPIPVDLVTASASGLDPQISYAGAMYQAARIARLRGVSIEQVKALVDKHTQHHFLNFIGEKRVNVLELNLELQTLKSGAGVGTGGATGATGTTISIADV